MQFDARELVYQRVQVNQESIKRQANLRVQLESAMLQSSAGSSEPKQPVEWRPQKSSVQLPSLTCSLAKTPQSAVCFKPVPNTVERYNMIDKIHLDNMNTPCVFEDGRVDAKSQTTEVSAEMASDFLARQAGLVQQRSKLSELISLALTQIPNKKWVMLQEDQQWFLKEAILSMTHRIYAKFYCKHSSHDFHPVAVLYGCLYIAFKQNLCSKVQNTSLSINILGMINDQLIVEVPGWLRNTEYLKQTEQCILESVKPFKIQNDFAIFGRLLRCIQTLLHPQQFEIAAGTSYDFSKLLNSPITISFKPLACTPNIERSYAPTSPGLITLNGCTPSASNVTTTITFQLKLPQAFPADVCSCPDEDIALSIYRRNFGDVCPGIVHHFRTAMALLMSMDVQALIDSPYQIEALILFLLVAEQVEQHVITTALEVVRRATECDHSQFILNFIATMTYGEYLGMQVDSHSFQARPSLTNLIRLQRQLEKMAADHQIPGLDESMYVKQPGVFVQQLLQQKELDAYEQDKRELQELEQTWKACGSEKGRQELEDRMFQIKLRRRDPDGMVFQ